MATTKNTGRKLRLKGIVPSQNPSTSSTPEVSQIPARPTPSIPSFLYGTESAARGGALTRSRTREASSSTTSRVAGPPITHASAADFSTDIPEIGMLSAEEAESPVTVTQEIPDSQREPDRPSIGPSEVEVETLIKSPKLQQRQRRVSIETVTDEDEYSAERRRRRRISEKSKGKQRATDSESESQHREYDEPTSLVKQALEASRNATRIAEEARRDGARRHEELLELIRGMNSARPSSERNRDADRTVSPSSIPKAGSDHIENDPTRKRRVAFPPYSSRVQKPDILPGIFEDNNRSRMNDATKEYSQYNARGPYEDSGRQSPIATSAYVPQGGTSYEFKNKNFANAKYNQPEEAYSSVPHRNTNEERDATFQYEERQYYEAAEKLERERQRLNIPRAGMNAPNNFGVHIPMDQTMRDIGDQRNSDMFPTREQMEVDNGQNPWIEDRVVDLLQRAFISEEQAAARGESMILSRFGVKLPIPEAYDGKDDLMVFENWLMKVLGWFEMSNLNAISSEMNRIRITILSQMLNGRALDYYRERLSQFRMAEEWDFSVAILEIRKRFVRQSTAMDSFRKYNTMTQGSRDVQTLMEELMAEARKIPGGGPSPFFIRSRFMEALRRDIAAHIIERGLRPETHNLKEIVRAAMNYEESLLYSRRYMSSQNIPARTNSSQKTNASASESKKQSTSHSSRPLNAQTASQPMRQKFTPQSNKYGGSRPSRPSGVDRNTPLRQPEANKTASGSGHRPTPRRNEADKPPSNPIVCYLCGEAGHISPNCPKKSGQPRGYAARLSDAEEEDDPNTGLIEEIETSPEKLVDADPEVEDHLEFRDDNYEGQFYSPDNEIYRLGEETSSETDEGINDKNVDEVKSCSMRLMPWTDKLLIQSRVSKLNSPPLPSLNRTRALPKVDKSQPQREKSTQRCVEITIKLNGRNARALLDSGSTTDMISPAFVGVNKLPTIELEVPMALQLAVSGSRAKINYGTRAKIEFGPISEERYFDISNIDDYDVILGTPFCWSNGISPIFEDEGWISHRGKRIAPNSAINVAPIPAKPPRINARGAHTDASQFFRGEGTHRC